MKITKLQHHGKEELFKKFRKVTLLGKNKVKNPPYIFQKADITLQEFPIEDMHPAQFYFLKESLETKRNLQETFLQKNIDIFHLDGFLEYKVSKTTYTLLPPIIEFTKTSEGQEVALIADGFHRISIAKSQKKKTIQVIVIKNIPSQYAFPAYPNPRGWKDVVIEGLPDDPIKKRLWRYPQKTAYTHYQDFGSVFENSSKPLSTSKIKKPTPRISAAEELGLSE